jgi:hypothetical protein
MQKIPDTPFGLMTDEGIPEQDPEAKELQQKLSEHVKPEQA